MARAVQRWLTAFVNRACRRPAVPRFRPDRARGRVASASSGPLGSCGGIGVGMFGKRGAGAGWTCRGYRRGATPCCAVLRRLVGRRTREVRRPSLPAMRTIRPASGS
jgi:hypothetical protein